MESNVSLARPNLCTSAPPTGPTVDLPRLEAALTMANEQQLVLADMIRYDIPKRPTL